jgi:hypothetical protein
MKAAASSRIRGAALTLTLSLAGFGAEAARGATDPLPAFQTNCAIPDSVARLLPRETDEAGFRPLFGQNAHDGWAHCGPGSFALSNGVATSQGGMGLWWCTNRTFTNFVVRGEWRLAAADSDSGVFIRFPNPGNDPWNAVRQGYEMEIGDDPTGKEPAWRTGAIYPFNPPVRVPTRPVGDWNRFELIAVGHTYVVRINSETVNVWTDPRRRTPSGHIGLQNYQEGKAAQFRNLRVRPLPAEKVKGPDLRAR